ncbi:hypothetical protein [Marinobacter guineae]|uniref:hypothetical protein n=1 Tax=Marinobacter guineae TaxID=432303 RepID=UPI00117CF53C|nr:hypothetical protein [Marinobacter guineae]
MTVAWFKLVLVIILCTRPGFVSCSIYGPLHGVDQQIREITQGWQQRRFRGGAQVIAGTCRAV